MEIKWVYLLPLLLLLSCGADQIDKEAILREMAAERIAKFKKNGLRDCNNQVLEAANLKADSLLLERARRMRLLANRPPKPRRPGLPAQRELSAELPLRPLFPYEVRFDTVLRQQLTLDSLLLDSLQFVDTLECSDCYVWSADFPLPQVWTGDNGLGAPAESVTISRLDTLEAPGIYPIYRLLCGLKADCLRDQTYSETYRNQLYQALFLRPRALELCLQYLDPEGLNTASYIELLEDHPGEEIDFDLLLLQIDKEIVEEELRQQLEELLAKARGE